jgi:DNA-binding protein H-NS
MNLHELNNLPLHELRELIIHAERVLKERQKEARKGVIQQIHALAADVGLSVTIVEEGPKGDRRSARKGSRVAPKYRNPHNHDQTWSGRGVKPRWLAELVNQGRDINEFLI